MNVATLDISASSKLPPKQSEYQKAKMLTFEFPKELANNTNNSRVPVVTNFKLKSIKEAQN